MTLDTLRTWTPAQALAHAGAKPSKRRSRWTPCPLCGGADVWAGDIAWTCHSCGVSLDAVGTGRRLSDGTIRGALEWAGLEDSVPGRYRVPSRPLDLDWRPFWPDVHWVDLLPIAALDTPDLSIRAREAARRPGTDHVRAARGLEAVAGREAVGMVWDSLLGWEGS